MATLPQGAPGGAEPPGRSEREQADRFAVLKNNGNYLFTRGTERLCAGGGSLLLRKAHDVRRARGAGVIFHRAAVVVDPEQDAAGVEEQLAELIFSLGFQHRPALRIVFVPAAQRTGLADLDERFPGRDLRRADAVRSPLAAHAGDDQLHKFSPLGHAARQRRAVRVRREDQRRTGLEQFRDLVVARQQPERSFGAGGQHRQMGQQKDAARVGIGVERPFDEGDDLPSGQKSVDRDEELLAFPERVAAVAGRLRQARQIGDRRDQHGVGGGAVVRRSFGDAHVVIASDDQQRSMRKILFDRGDAFAEHPRLEFGGAGVAVSDVAQLDDERRGFGFGELAGVREQRGRRGLPHFDVADMRLGPGDLGIGVKVGAVVVDVAEHEHPVGVRVIRRRDQTEQRHRKQKKQLLHDIYPFRGAAAAFCTLILYTAKYSPATFDAQAIRKEHANQKRRICTPSNPHSPLLRGHKNSNLFPAHHVFHNQ